MNRISSVHARILWTFKVALQVWMLCPAWLKLLTWYPLSYSPKEVVLRAIGISAHVSFGAFFRPLMHLVYLFDDRYPIVAEFVVRWFDHLFILLHRITGAP